MTPEDHDVLVSFVSHVPQLAASTLMDVATTHEARAPRAAAARGGRVPRHDADRGEPADDLARHPHVEPRRGARCARRVPRRAATGARHRRRGRSRRAARRCSAGRASARRNLPVGISMATKLVELRIPVPDRPGVLAEVTTLAGRLGVNVADIEIAHSKEGGAGVLVLIVAADDADGVRSRPARPRLPHRPDGHRVSVDVADAERARRRRRAAAARDGCGFPATSRSRTGR